MKSVFHVTVGNDIYEVALHGKLIVRITRYANGTQHFTEIEKWDALTEEVKNKIEVKARELIPNDA